jgi:hypothetical protein
LLNKKDQKRYAREHYLKNKETYRIGVKVRRKKQRAFILKYRGETGCIKCGEKHPACLDSHHRDPSKKEFAISSSAARGIPMKRLLEELAKTDTLCSNCHKKLHWESK